jgi:hypothetical protein
VSAIPTLPVLDFRALSDDQLATAEDIFNDFRDRELKPAYLADADPNRAHLDRRIVCDRLMTEKVHDYHDGNRYYQDLFDTRRLLRWEVSPPSGAH